MKFIPAQTCLFLEVLLLVLGARAWAATYPIVPGKPTAFSYSENSTEVFIYESPGDERIGASVAWVGGVFLGAPLFDVVAPDGTFLTTSWSQVQSIVLRDAGTYQFISRSDPGLQLGEYEVTFIRQPGPNVPDDGESGQIVAGQTVKGSGGWSDMDVYEYESLGPERLTIAMAFTSGGSVYQPVFDVIGPDGTALASGSQYVQGLLLAGAGVYQIVSRATNRFDSGEYELTVIKHPGPNVADDGESGQIVAGQTVKGSGGWSDMDVYEYESLGPERLTIATARTSGGSVYEPVFDVIGPDGTALASGSQYVQGLLLTGAGVYQIVSRAKSRFDSGEYELTVIKQPGPNVADDGESGQIVAGQTVKGSGGWSDMDVYEYESLGPERLTIAMAFTSGGSVYQPVFDVIGPDGTALASGSQYVQGLMLAGAGVYQIVSRAKSRFDSGEYELTVIKHPGPNVADDGESGQIVAGQTVKGSGGWSDMDVYEFQGAVGDVVSIGVRNENGGANYLPVIELYNPDGTLMVKGTRIRLVCLIQVGVFQIVCRDSDFFDAGEYSLRMDITPASFPVGMPGGYLDILTCSNVSVLRWASSAREFRLQSTTTFPQPPHTAIWLDHLPPYFERDGLYYFTNGFSDAQRFFRLLNVPGVPSGRGGP